MLLLDPRRCFSCQINMKFRQDGGEDRSIVFTIWCSRGYAQYHMCGKVVTIHYDIQGSLLALVN